MLLYSENYIHMCKTADAAAERVAAAVEWAKRIALDDSHGYSQASRYGPNYDCSSMVITAFKQVGVPIGNAITTYNMRSEFLRCGWKDVTGSVSLSSGGRT